MVSGAPFTPHKNFTVPQLYEHADNNADFGCVMTGESRFGTDTQGAAMVIDRKGLLHYLDDPINAPAVEAQVLKLLAEK